MKLYIVMWQLGSDNGTREVKGVFQNRKAAEDYIERNEGDDNDYWIKEKILEDKMKICPLLQTHINPECLGDKCAWWCEDTERCAMSNFNKFYDLYRFHKGLEWDRRQCEYKSSKYED